MRLGTNRAEEVRQDLIAASQLLVHLLVSHLTYLVVLCCCIQAPFLLLPVYLLFASPLSTSLFGTARMESEAGSI